MMQAKSFDFKFDPKEKHTFTREDYFKKIFDKAKSIDSKKDAEHFVRMIDFFTKSVYSGTIEEIVESLKEQSPTPEATSYNVALILQEFNEWLQVPHPEITPERGAKIRTKSDARRKYYVKKKVGIKKHGAKRIRGYINQSKNFISLRTGVEVTKTDIQKVVSLQYLGKSDPDDERGEPLTTKQAKRVFDLQKDVRSKAIYVLMNDAGLREMEIWKLQQKHFVFKKNHVRVKITPENSKGGYSGGTRYLTLENWEYVKATFKDNMPDRHPFRTTEKQGLFAFRSGELQKIRAIYDKLGMTQRYDDSSHHWYNLYSWRKRCISQYALIHGRDMAHAYGRHNAQLAMYTKISRTRRIEMFFEAQEEMSLTNTEKLESKIALEKSKREEAEKNEAIANARAEEAEVRAEQSESVIKDIERIKKELKLKD